MGRIGSHSRYRGGQERITQQVWGWAGEDHTAGMGVGGDDHIAGIGVGRRGSHSR